MVAMRAMILVGLVRMAWCVRVIGAWSGSHGVVYRCSAPLTPANHLYACASTCGMHLGVCLIHVIAIDMPPVPYYTKRTPSCSL